MAVTTTHPHTAFRESPERRAEGSRRPVRILLVEDDDDVRLLLTLVLKRAGYEVSATPNADQALQALHRGRHDLILTDYCLPRKDGLEFLAEARSEGTLAGAPVILCTAFPPNRLSGVTVVEKPIDLDALLQQIRAALKR
jgi:two-component system, OmpR family, phosphate regulon response regulator PhoB